MTSFTILELSGQVLQIVAGFILSVEVIGLKRVARWAKSLRVFKVDLLADDDSQEHRRKNRRKSLVETLLSVLVAVLLILLMKFFISGLYNQVGLITRFSPWVLTIPFLFLGCVLFWCCYRLLITSLSLAISTLLTLERRTRARATGVLGFLLLFVGFVMQFLGTVGQSLSTSR